MIDDSILLLSKIDGSFIVLKQKKGGCVISQNWHYLSELARSKKYSPNQTKAILCILGGGVATISTVFSKCIKTWKIIVLYKTKLVGFRANPI